MLHDFVQQRAIPFDGLSGKGRRSSAQSRLSYSLSEPYGNICPFKPRPEPYNISLKCGLSSLKPTDLYSYHLPGSEDVDS